MATPPQLRYWQIRAQALLNKPVLWCSGLAVVLLAVVLRQYQTHPEWLGQFELDSNSPGQTLADSTLSPEEQAGVADIDNLRALYGALNSAPSAPSAPTPGAGAPAQPSTDLLKILQSPTPSAGQPSNGQPLNGSAANEPTSPFAAYLQQYRFLGAQPPASSLGSGLNATPQPQPSLLMLSGAQPGMAQPGTSSASPSNTPAPSALEQALQQQLSRSRTGAPVSDQASEQSPAANGSNSTGAAISPATLPGTDQPFLRTTPQMSPPPGTTGYVPPVTLPNPTAGNAYTAYPSTLPGAAAVTPNLSPVSPGQGANLAVPGATGTVLPPAAGSQYTAPDASLPQPEPFAVPRPPGSHTGGGYIYTFSDPNGPPQ